LSKVDIPQHLAALRAMMIDWQLGRHLLLIGNQGVGKNKLAARFLGMLRLEREYLQLHRDASILAESAMFLSKRTFPVDQLVNHGKSM
jgi:MoxR-like ATPase